MIKFRWPSLATLASVRTGLCFSGLWIAVSLIGGCDSQNPETAPMEFHGHTMGVTYSVKVRPLPPGVTAGEVNKNIADILGRLNKLFTTYSPTSEISRFSSSTSTDWFPVSKDVCIAVAESLRVSRLSDGAFDITVAPLVNLWGFGPEYARNDIPKLEEIRATMQRVGYQHLQARCDDKPALRKDLSGIAIDLSSIGHGYGSDRVADYLDSIGVQNYLVDVDHDMRERGVNPNGQQWRIGIEKPIPGVIEIARIIYLKNIANSTSGTYRNFFEYGGTQYSHLLDPKTGFPIKYGFISVTSLSSKAMTAGVLSTMLSVLGPERGYELAVKEGLAAIFILYDGKNLMEKITPKAQPYLEE